MSPHQQLALLDAAGVAYHLIRYDVQVGQNLMAFVEYEVLSHDADWINIRECSMQIKTGPRNGWFFSKEDLEANGTRKETWQRWFDISPFAIQQEGQ